MIGIVGSRLSVRSAGACPPPRFGRHRPAGDERALQVVRDEATTFGLDPHTSPLAIGLATYPDYGADPWTVLAAADHDLYRAKRNGSGLAVA